MSTLIVESVFYLLIQNTNAIVIFLVKSNQIILIVKKQLVKLFALNLILIFLIGIWFISVIPTFHPLQFYDEARIVQRGLNTLSKSDIQLMEWMRSHLNPSSNILVSRFDSGQYVTPLTNLRSTFPPDEFLQNYNPYKSLIIKLINDPTDPEVFILAKKLNITHLFIGSRVMDFTPTIKYWNISTPKMDPLKIATSPYFSLVKAINGSYMFELKDDMLVNDNDVTSWSNATGD
jgi:hypothetical protein